MVSLVTGSGGFIGSWLVEHMERLGHTVVRMSRSEPNPVDLLDEQAVRGVISNTRPDWIFHLAAQSLPRVSWADPAGTFRANVDGTVNLLEAVRAAGITPSIIVAGSSSIYRQRPDGSPIREDDPAGPLSPYAVSKLAEEHLARVYAQKYGMRVTAVRPFFLIGPRKSGDVCSDFARGIVAVERGRAPDLPVGNTRVVRDFLDVRDGVRALVLVAEKGRPGSVYNICSGHGYEIDDVLQRFKKMSSIPVREREDAALMRPIDEAVKVGDATRLKSLGWQPERDMDGTLCEILEYWRAEERAA
ncbi:MAG: GDP-mannose 4,6-dehydratase [bacterium]